MIHFCSLEEIPLGKEAVVVAEKRVYELFGKRIKTPCILFEGGEVHKTRETKAHLEDHLFSLGATKNVQLIALGGGMTLDLTGFLAGTFLRGVECLYVPTTLVAMADAAHGGKCGVNTPWGKNLIGFMSAPKRIYIDLSTLETLPLPFFRDGFSEIIKHAALKDSEFFDFLWDKRREILSKEPSHLRFVIEKSISIKNHFVAKDPYDRGVRRYLNFGHTLGHMLEVRSNYTLSHGEAVAIGMVKEAEIATNEGILDQVSLERLKELLQLYGLPTQSEIPIDSALLARDKKSDEGALNLYVIETIGAVYEKPLRCDFRAEPIRCSKAACRS